VTQAAAAQGGASATLSAQGAQAAPAQGGASATLSAQEFQASASQEAALMSLLLRQRNELKNAAKMMHTANEPA